MDALTITPGMDRNDFYEFTRSLGIADEALCWHCTRIEHDRGTALQIAEANAASTEGMGR